MGGVVCKMPIFRQACTSIVENVQVFIQTTIPVQGRTQQTHFNTVGNFHMMALCNQIGSFVWLSPCHFVYTKYSKHSHWACYCWCSLTIQGFIVALQIKEVKKRGDKLLSLKNLQYKFLTALAHTWVVSIAAAWRVHAARCSIQYYTHRIFVHFYLS